MVILKIKKKEFDLIAAGTKKSEWRASSNYNVKQLLAKNDKGKYDKNTAIKEIKFVNGYKKDSPALMAEVLLIRPVKFQCDMDFPDDNFKAYEGQCGIEIKLGKITIL